MHAILAYIDTIVFNIVRKVAYENFCATYDMRSYSPSRTIAITGNLRVIISKSNKNVNVIIKCGKIRDSFQITLKHNKLIYGENEVDVSSFIYMIPSIENKLYSSMLKISDSCNIQEICYRQSKVIKEILVEGYKVDISEEIKRNLEQILTLFYRKNVSVGCKANLICIRKAIVSGKKVYLQLADPRKQNYWYLEINELIDKMPDYAQEILAILRLMRKTL
ncbi:hypothetical protein V6M85_12525 [Sulfolobus tengchongensis]|uniref:Uncharacterized protein n=1 Tax=Sulfolobus tengchongensis TaxID=207809 RepID=A0AAX4L297_9CREN